MATLKLLALGLLATILPIAAAHPGEDIHAEVLKRREFLEKAPNLRKRCAPSLQARGHVDKSVARRRDLAQNLRASRGLPLSKPFLKRSLISVLETDHNRTLDYANITIETPQDSFFTDNSSCILWPHVELPEGPYYVEGELIRSNAIEDLEGVYMMLDLQLIDVETCEPVKNQYVEFWQANHTGVYSGTVGNGNGNPDDTSNLNNTWLHAVQPTDEQGVVQIETLFPGHYAPRATHTHLLVRQDATVLPNNTLAGGSVSHVGQVFFDQDLIYEVDTIYPYTLNPNAVKLNSQDMVLIAEAEYTDPIVNYVYLGDTIADGILGWITVGINASAVFDVQNAAWWTANGGVENPDQPQAGPGGGGGGGGRPPVMRRNA